MTADHLGAYGDNIIFIQGYIDELRVIGRLAAVLFLFAAIESLKHTQLMLASDPFSKRRNFLTFWFTLYKLKP